MLHVYLPEDDTQLIQFQNIRPLKELIHMESSHLHAPAV
jgi:hypothetical protein